MARSSLVIYQPEQLHVSNLAHRIYENKTISITPGESTSEIEIGLDATMITIEEIVVEGNALQQKRHR